MKKLILLLLWMYSTHTLFAQDIRQGTHITNYAITITPCNIFGAPTGATAEVLVPEKLFKIINPIGVKYIIQVIEFKNNALLNTKFVGPPATPLYFLMTIADYNASAEKATPKGSFIVGASTTLVKIRPGKKEPKDGYNIYSEFGNDFNIGISAGLKLRPKRHVDLYHNFVIGLSFSSIKVTPYTSKDFLKDESIQSCITPTFGYIIEYDNFQVGGFIGMDIMAGEVGRQWIYRKRPWLGIGFGYKIFQANTTKQ